MKGLKFVTGEPALLAGKTLFIADTHVGIEHEYRKSGLSMPSQTPKILLKIESLLEQTKASRLVLIGDIKHKVPGISWQETKELPAFLQRLAKKTQLHVVPGNHDGGMAKFIPKGVKLYPMEGALFGNVYACHGHAWPESSFLEARHLLMSHSHPQVEFRDRLGYRWGERVWIRARLDKNKIRMKYPKAETLPELIIMPAFNPLSGGIPVNRKILEGCRPPSTSIYAFPPERSPVLKAAKMRSAKIYMLDGTYLGELGKI